MVFFVQPPSRKTSSEAPLILAKANVSVTLALEEIGDVRNLLWEAGLVRANGMDFMEAIATVTRNPAQAFGLYDTEGVGQIQVGKKANFLAFSADPLSLQSSLRITVLDQTPVCKPTQS